MADPSKYAVVERERRYLVSRVPDGVTSTKEITDRYVTGTRLRLREVREDDGTIVRKLGHKVRITDGPAAIACTNIYLDDAEWEVLASLPGRSLRKKRHMVRRNGWLVVVDEHEDGTLVAEIDDGDDPSDRVPGGLEVVRELTHDEGWTGARLAR
jgi:CYTH domain-containing protein